MTTITPSTPTNCFNPYADPNSLTGESLLLYCQTQLSSYDDTISGFLNEQKLNLARKKGLSGIENTIKKYANHLDQTGVNDINKAFHTAMDALPPGDPVRGAIQAKADEFYKQTAPFDANPNLTKQMTFAGTTIVNPFEPKSTVWGMPMTPLPSQQIFLSSEQVTAYAGDIHSMLDNVNGNAEINMIQLQQVMSQRQTAVQLTTSLLAKLDEGTKSVVGNIGR